MNFSCCDKKVFLVLCSFCFLSTFALGFIKKIPKKLSCAHGDDGNGNNEENVTQLVPFDEYKCKNSQTGAYRYEIDLLDGTRHIEEGLVDNGQFIIRGFFLSHTDTEVSQMFFFLISDIYKN